MTVRLQVHLVYTYDVVPSDYPNQDPRAMAELDVTTDPTVVLDADWTISAAKLVEASRELA